MKILITGVHGFVGSNVVAALGGEHQIYGVDIVAPENKNVIRTYSWEDVDAGVVKDVDAVIHLAGMARDTSDRSEAEAYFEVNTGLTQKIFDWFLKSTAKKFIFFSSVKAAAHSVLGDALTEGVVPHPVGPYGESKLKAEEYIRANASADRQVYILRPCMIHGLGHKGSLKLMYSFVSRGLPWPLGGFDNRRSFTSVGNMCYVVDELLNKPVPSGIYNLGDDEALSTNELVEIICKTIGIKPHFLYLGNGFIKACAAVGTALRLPLNKERLSKLTESYVVSNSKIKSALGIEKMPVRAVDGVSLTIKSFQR